jgi:hypothetical protein
MILDIRNINEKRAGNDAYAFVLAAYIIAQSDIIESGHSMTAWLSTDMHGLFC